MPSIQRYITLLLVALCSLVAFPQSKKPIPTIYIPYADTISQELIDSIYRMEGKYVLLYHPDMAHLIPEMRCRRTFVPGKRIGVFSVAKEKQVSFSQGNLQYTQSKNQWRFADNQYDYIGTDNVKDGALADRIDLFGWSGKDSKAPWGVSTSTTASDYAGEFLDWGTNVVQGDAAGIWRTLSKEEWEYLRYNRKNAENLIAIAEVNGVNGLIILPDDWVSPDDVNFKLGFSEDCGVEHYASYQVIDIDVLHKMEQCGAVFLPAACRRIGTKVDCIHYGSRCWTAAMNGIDKAFYFYLTSCSAGTSQGERTSAHSVRLVHDTIVPPPAPCRTVEVNGVTFNMMCVEGGTFRMDIGSENYKEESGVDATKDSTTHLVTLSDYYIAETAVTQALWKAVMGTDVEDLVAVSPYPTEKPKKGDAYPIGYVRLSDAIAFIDRLNQLTGLNFRLPTEAEWEYAARGGKKSRGFSYSGSDDSNEVASSYGSRVAQKKSNELGIYDMSGCTREMCSDIWKNKYIYDSHVANPVGPIQTSGNRVLRGGTVSGVIAHPYSRAAYTPIWCGSSMGFRLVLPTDQQRRMIYVSDTTYYTENDTLKTSVLYSYFEMVYVEGGTFMMGATADDADAGADEKPQHQVTLSDYYIGQVEVTQQLWNTVLGTANNPSSRKGNNLPVNNVSWDDCQRFIARLNELTGLHFRLPTEAEWEYAARGGERSKGYKYSGSNDVNEVAWTSANSGSKTHDVGTKLPNELGIFDMSGNLWEWCQDWNVPYTSDAQVNPQGPESGEYRMYRGGGFGYNSADCRVTRRRRTASYYKEALGLRLVLEVETNCQVTMCGSVTMSETSTHPACYEDGFIGGGIITIE